jgi:prophage antirepressor-like protein
MANLQLFNFETQEIRFIGDKPVASDIAKVLGYKHPADAVYNIVKAKNKTEANIQTAVGIRTVFVLEEAGIYQLIFQSKLPNAERFQDWVFEEVLPSIRKTGSYSFNQPKQVVFAAYYNRMGINQCFVPDGYWCVFDQSHFIMRYIECDLKYPTLDFDLVDGSIGKHYAMYREGKEWAKDVSTGTIDFKDKRGIQPIHVYPLNELGYFDYWLKKIYKTEHLPKYLNDKAIRHKRDDMKKLNCVTEETKKMLEVSSSIYKPLPQSKTKKSNVLI